jgi:WD40 repeat protein
VVLLALAGGGGSSARAGAPRPGDAPLPDLKAVSTTDLGGRDLGGHTQDVGSAGISRDGSLVATGCYDRNVRVFDAGTGRMLHIFDFGDDVDSTPDRFGLRTRGLQNGVVFDAEGKRLAAVGGNWLMPPAALAAVFDLAAEKPVFTWRAARSMLHRAAFSGDGSVLVTAGPDSTLRVLDAATGKERGAFTGHDWVVDAVAFAPDGKTVASACANSKKRSLLLWDPLTLKESQNIPLPDGVNSLNDLAFSPDGKRVAGVSNWRLHVWDAATGKPAGGAVVDEGLFTRLAFSPDGKRVAVVGGQGGDGKAVLRVYDSTTDRVFLAFVDADLGKELLAVAWPAADRILAVGVRGTAAKLITVRLNR